MVPIFNLRGFTAVDPLDRAPAAMQQSERASDQARSKW